MAAMGTALHVRELGLAHLLKLKALGLPLLLASLARDGEQLFVLPQAPEEVLWAIALILFRHGLLVVQVRIETAPGVNLARVHSHLPEVALLQRWQLVLCLIVFDLLKVYVLVVQVVAIDSSLVSDLSLLQDLQEELKSDFQ